MSPASITSRAGQSWDLQGKHILVVEDEEHLAVGITFNLKKAGYRVTTVGDGPTALHILETQGDDIDLVVLDIMLPGMSGYTVCESIRSTGRTMPVLILSARTLPEDRIRGFEVGANQYMMKPFDLDEFLIRVRNLLLHASQPGGAGEGGVPEAVSPTPVEEEYAFGEAVVNFRTFEVTVHGEKVRMTAQDMRLLRYFIENRNRLIPRQELLEKVWDMPGHVQTRAPDQYIRRLRKVFEPDPSKPSHFLTIRDAGYRFVSDAE